MAFDEQKFRKLAAEQGYSAEEIDSHISNVNKATGQPFGQASDAAQKATVQEFANAGAPMPGAEATDSRSTLEKTFDFFGSPLGTATIGLFGAGAGALVQKGIQSRKINPPAPEFKEPVLVTTQEIVKPGAVNYEIPAYQRAANNVAATQPTETALPKSPQQILQERVAAGRAAGLGVQPPAAPQLPQGPVAPQGAIPPAQQGPATVTEEVVAGGNPAKAIQKDLAQQIDVTPSEPVAPAESGVKKRAAKTTVTYKKPEQFPADMTFRADLGPGDNWLYNTYGAEGRKAILAQYNNGQPVGSYERAKEISAAIQGEKVGPVIPRDVAKERGIAPPETNYGKLGKAVKVGGVAGLALTAAQLANAAQRAKEGDYAPASEFGFDLGVLAGLAKLFGGPAAMAGSAMMGGRGLNQGEEAELAKRWKKGSKTPAQPTID